MPLSDQTHLLYQGSTDDLKHDFGFDPRYGYTPDDLKSVGAPTECDGFVEFWKDTFAANSEIPLNMAIENHEHSHKSYDIRIVYVDTWGGFRTGAWVVAPTDRNIEKGLVVGHGYGGRECYDLMSHIKHAAFIFPVARGFHISSHDDLPLNNGHEHVLVDIDSRDDYIIRGCVAELWSAATVLQELYPEIERNLHYIGGSFGGGLGALMLPWDDRFTSAHLSVPTFGQHPIRVQLQAIGSSEPVRLRHQKQPEISDVLAFYDAAVAATHINIPVLAAPALFDPAVQPPGQFAVANSLAGDVSLFISSAGHFEYPDQAKEHLSLTRHVADFFN